MNGITVAGYGLGSLIFTHVQTAYLNPQNFSPDADGYFHDEKVLSRVPSLFVLLGGLYLAMQLIGCCLIFTPPKQPNEIIFDEGRFLLIRSPSQEGALTFESPIGNPNDLAGGYSSCDDQDVASRPPSPVDLRWREAIRTKEFLLVSAPA